MVTLRSLTVSTMNGAPDRSLPLAPSPAEERLPAIGNDEIETARGYADKSKAASTRRAYASDWRRFDRWYLQRGIDSLPADPRAVAVFLSVEADAGAAPLTVGRRLAAIAWMHKRAGLLPSQAREGAAAITEVVAGIRRSHGAAPDKKHAADADILRDILKAIPGRDIHSVRDRALLAFGMAGAFRRSELVALRLADIAFVPEGLRVTIPRSKTDQEGVGVVVAIPEGRRIRPKALLEAWITQGGIAEVPVPALGGRRRRDPLPMSDRAVARLVKRRAAAAGYTAKDFAGHSLRSGFLTAAARAGASVFKMCEVSRHKSMQVLADYVRDAELFRDHAGEGFL
jgi:site-specific recombinase XerD